MDFLPVDVDHHSIFQSSHEAEIFFPPPTASRTTAHFPSSSPHLDQDFHGVSPLLMMRRSMSFSGVERSTTTEQEVRTDLEEMSDEEGSQSLGEKKRRLNLEQVKALEKSFELGNKLEPERKMQLARALGLQPRQIAIWFQNRRARWKTKQLERDYEVLKRKFDALKADNDSLRAHNNKLHSELLALKNREPMGSGDGPINLNKENEVCWSNGSDNGIDVNLSTATARTTSADSSPPTPNQKHVLVPSPTTLTQVLMLQNSSSRSDRLRHHHSHKIDQTNNVNIPADHDSAAAAGFCNMFVGAAGVEEHPGFWGWSDQHFHQLNPTL